MKGITLLKGFFNTTLKSYEIDWRTPVDRFDPVSKRHLKGRPSQGFGTANFNYAGKDMSPIPWETNFKVTGIKSILEKQLGVEFYFCLAGLYKDETSSIPYHYDVIEHDDDVIVSVSFGPPRLFVIKEDDGTVHNYILENGDVLVMTGASQRNSQHAVPALVNPSTSRINLTFRTKRSYE